MDHPYVSFILTFENLAEMVVLNWYKFFLYKQHLYKQHQAETGKKLVNAKQHPETEHSLFENYLLSSFT